MSNTFAVVEDAGRDARYIANGEATYDPPTEPTRSRPIFGPTNARRFWRWAEADGAYGVSGVPNNNRTQIALAHEPGAYPPLASPSRNNNVFNNDEMASFHPGGVNALFGDGSVRFIKDGVNVVVCRKLVTLAGGEITSASDY